MNGMHISGVSGSWKGPGCYAQSWNYTLWGTVTPGGLQQGDGAARQDHTGQKRGWMGGGGDTGDWWEAASAFQV